MMTTENNRPQTSAGGVLKDDDNKGAAILTSENKEVSSDSVSHRIPMGNRADNATRTSNRG